MNREEAKKEMLNMTGSIYTKTALIEDLIDKIYDELENKFNFIESRHEDIKNIKLATNKNMKYKYSLDDNG